ncbi:helix-turn-helix domain-containing protein [Macrococcus equi]|uniref:helix-turn-helix domain-containing protein n=1 Tax=Macrococcus equi TaxID=3395462 RepID=UPI0039BE5D68
MKFEEKVDAIYPSLSKRAKLVVDLLKKHGKVSTYELKELHGYSHPPRAIRDVKESGIPIIRKMEKNSINNSKMAVYYFGEFESFREDILKGRKNFPKKFKDELYKKHDYKCGICKGKYPGRDLQVDHRIPFEVSGDIDDTGLLKIETYMPLCPSDNRKKSFTCEQCENWKLLRNKDICFKCYWANPHDYTHIAMREERRIELVFLEKNKNLYDDIEKRAFLLNESPSDYVIDVLKNNLK